MTEFRYNCKSRQQCWLTKRWDPASVGKAWHAKHGEWPCEYAPGKPCTPTDIDGFMERNGHCLFIETKTAGTPVPLGQKIAFAALVAAGHHVLVQECDPPSGDVVVSLSLHKPNGEIYVEGEPSAFARDRLLKRWWDWAGRTSSINEIEVAA